MYNTGFHSTTCWSFPKFCLAQIPLALGDLDSAQLVPLVLLDVGVAILHDQAQSTSVEQLGFGVPMHARLENMNSIISKLQRFSHPNPHTQQLE